MIVPGIEYGDDDDIVHIPVWAGFRSSARHRESVDF